MIAVFKTNVLTKKDARELIKKLEEQFPTGLINFDLQDCDKILRADTSENPASIIIQTLNKHGFSCIELD